MVFRVIVERCSSGEAQSAEAPSAAPQSSASVFETFLGPHGEELVAPRRLPDGSDERGGVRIGVDELEVSAVRLFRMGGECGGLHGLDAPTPLSRGGGATGAAGALRHGLAAFDSVTLPTQRTSALLLLAVPVELTLAGLRSFFGPSLEDDVETLRVLRWAEPPAVEGLVGRARTISGEASEGGLSGDFYAVVLLCRTQEAADAFYQQHHGRILCEGRQPLTGYGGAPEAVGGPCCYLLFLEAVAYRDVAADGRGAPLDVPNVAIELPMCPFCLERLDVSVTGMITHNAGWLSSMEWDEVPHSRCCAACAAIYRAGPLEGAEGVPPPVCKRCSSGENLWVCLVCGHLGCGRYAQGHAKDHASEAGHHFCLDLSSGRIWHYAGDVFVHRRLVQMAAASGRFEVALPEPAEELAAAARSSADGAGAVAGGTSGGGSKSADALREGQLAMELDAVLASQLDYQRSLHEAKLRVLEEQHQAAVVEMRARGEAEEARRQKLEAELAEAQHRRGRGEQRHAKAQQSRARAEEELEFAKELNRSLLANRAEMQRKGDTSSQRAETQTAADAAEDDPLVCRLRKQVEKLMAQVSALA